MWLFLSRHLQSMHAHRHTPICTYAHTATHTHTHTPQRTFLAELFGNEIKYISLLLSALKSCRVREILYLYTSKSSWLELSYVQCNSEEYQAEVLHTQPHTHTLTLRGNVLTTHPKFVKNVKHADHLRSLSHIWHTAYSQRSAKLAW